MSETRGRENKPMYRFDLFGSVNYSRDLKFEVPKQFDFWVVHGFLRGIVHGSLSDLFIIMMWPHLSFDFQFEN